MKLKTIVLLMIVLCLLSVAAFYLYKDEGVEDRSQTMGEKLFADLPLEKIVRITVTSPRDIVVLKKEDSLWRIENRLGYFADFSMITGLVSRLKQAKISRSFDATEAAVARLDLSAPDPKTGSTGSEGIGVEIQDGQENVLLQIIIGKTRENAVGAGEGNYVMFPGGDLIFLVDKDFSKIGRTYLEWMKKNIIDVDKEEIEKITCYDPDGKLVYTLVRKERGQDPVLEGGDPEKSLDRSRLDDVLTPLSPMSIIDIVADVQDSPIPQSAFSYYFKYGLYDGTLFKIVPGKYAHAEQNVYYLLKVERLQSPAIPIEPGTETIYAHMNRWIYQIPEWKYKRFIPHIETLYETTSKE